MGPSQLYNPVPKDKHKAQSRIKEDYLICEKHNNQEILNLYDVDKKIFLCTNCVVEDRTSPFNEMRRVRLIKECRARVVDDFKERESHLRDLEEGLKVREREIQLKKREIERKKRKIEKDVKLQIEDIKKLVEDLFEDEQKHASLEDPDQQIIFEDELVMIQNKKIILDKLSNINQSDNEGVRFLKYIESNCYSQIGWNRIEKEMDQFLSDHNVKDAINRKINDFIKRKNEQKTTIEINILSKLIDKLSKRREKLSKSIFYENKIEERYLKKNIYINTIYQKSN